MSSKKNETKEKGILTSFLKKNAKTYLSGIVFLIIINTLQLAIPRITGNAVNNILDADIDKKALLIYPGIILIIALLVFILNYLSRMQLIGASNLFDFLLRNKMFKHLTELPIKFFDKKGVGDLMALAVNDLRAIRMAMGRGIIIVTNTLVLMIASIIIMSRTMDLNMTMLLISPFPILIYIMLRFGTAINKRFKKVQESFANLTRKAQENISGIRVVKAFAQEEAEISNFKKINQENYQVNMNLAKVQGIFFPLIQMFFNFSYLAVLYYGGILVIRNTITFGDFVAFNSYVGIIVRPVRMIGMIITFIQRGRASLERINELFMEDTISSGKENVDIDEEIRFKGEIEFKNLSFSYNEDEEDKLKNINLKIEPGKTLGIVGKIGSGKTTLINLILRLYEVKDKGHLFIDGLDIKDIPHKILRDNIGYVSQENVLFSQTISENIAFSPRDFNPEEINDSAEISQVYDNIIEFPEKFDTLLGERGVNISGGQKQRISISRALIKNAPILILDDCLSAVDTDTERKIMEGLKDILKNHTCIIIAHRLSTIMEADEIIVLEEGEIVEKGSHNELLEMKGKYSEMYERQLLEEKAVNI